MFPASNCTLPILCRILNLHEEADLLMEINIDHLPASSQRIDEIKKAQASFHTYFLL